MSRLGNVDLAVSPLYWMRIVGILIMLVSTGISWWALQAFRFDMFLARPKGAQAKTLQVLLSLALGYLVSKFLTEYWLLSMGWFSDIEAVF